MTPWLGAPSELKCVEFAGMRGRLDNQQDTEMIPRRTARIVLFCGDVYDLNVRADSELKMTMGNVRSCPLIASQ